MNKFKIGVIGGGSWATALIKIFQENNFESSSIKLDKHIKYSSPPFTIYQGDIFDLQSGMIQADAWYDRAAMVALPNSVRQQYVKQIYNQTKPGAVGLLITFSYPEEQMEGPPFSLPDQAVMDYFSNGFEVECLENIDLGDEKERGLTSVTSSVFRIKRLA